jgi:hypothetical protein
MNMTTTDKNFLAQFTARTRGFYMDLLKVRNRDYEGYEPPDVAERRKANEKLHEHDQALEAIKRGILGIAGAFGKKKQ